MCCEPYLDMVEIWYHESSFQRLRVEISKYYVRIIHEENWNTKTYDISKLSSVMSNLSDEGYRYGYSFFV